MSTYFVSTKYTSSRRPKHKFMIKSTVLLCQLQDIDKELKCYHFLSKTYLLLEKQKFSALSESIS